jgi:stage II sporulation protein P
MKRFSQNYIAVTLVLAGIMTAFCFFSETDLPGMALQRLGENEKFAVVALSSELGFIPEEYAEHTPPMPDPLPEPETVTETAGEGGSLAQTEQDLILPDDSGIAPITIAPSEGSGSYASAGGVFLSNDSGLAVDAASMRKNPYRITLDQDGSVEVFLLHTHASEAYTPDETNYYTPTDNDRTTDTNFNVVRVGDEIEKTLTAMGIGVLHCREILDVPSYSGSYNKALEVIEDAVSKNPSIKIILDIHRDAMITSEGIKYKTVTQIGDQEGAQLMLVMGTNAGGLSFDHWQTNLNFAVNLQSAIQQQYPTLMRPINVRKQRFNEHVTTGSMLLEVGTSGNTLDEALLSARTFAKLLGDYITN